MVVGFSSMVRNPLFVLLLVTSFLCFEGQAFLFQPKLAPARHSWWIIKSQKLPRVVKTSFDAVTPGTTPNDSSVLIEGLLGEAEFRKLEAIHQTIQNLSRLIPALLTAPLSDQEIGKAFSEDTKLVLVAESSDEGSRLRNNGENDSIVKKYNDVELASSRQELLSLCNTFILAVRASARAGDLLSASSSILPLANSNRRQVSSEIQQSTKQPVVDCQIYLLDPHSPTRLRVDWQTKILIPLLDPQGGILQGRSELVLDDESGKVKIHKLTRIIWNGQNQGSKAIGQTLSSLRQSVLILQQSPLFRTLTSTSSGSSPNFTTSVFSSLLQAGQDWVQQQLLSPTDDLGADQASSTTITPAPIYTFTSRKQVSETIDGTPIETLIRKRVLVDQYENQNATSNNITSTFQLSAVPPLPGSKSWQTYAATHRLFTEFIKVGIPLLSGQNSDIKNSGSSSSQQLQSLFSSNAQFITIDNSLLLQGGSQIAKFYESFTAWRKRSFGTLTLQKVTVVAWNDTRIQIDYTIGTQLPGMSAFKTEGTDLFDLAPPNISNAYSDTESPAITILKVQQLKLNANNGASKQNMLFFLRSLAAAAESGRGMGSIRSIGDSDVWLTELLRFFQGKNTSSTTLGEVSQQQEIKRDEAAAATVYSIMDSLLRDVPNILKRPSNFDAEAAGSRLQTMFSAPEPPPAAPAIEFMTENIELRGYFDEVLLRSRSAYERNWRWAMSWLQLAFRTKQLAFKADINGDSEVAVTGPVKVRVELTQQRNVRTFVTLNLVIPSLLTDWSLRRSTTGLDEKTPSNRGELPYKVSLISDYILDKSSGRIIAHRMIESRINDLLTPGDVVAKLVKKQQQNRWQPNKDGRVVEEDASIQSIVETINWVRSLGKSDLENTF